MFGLFRGWRRARAGGIGAAPGRPVPPARPPGAAAEGGGTAKTPRPRSEGRAEGGGSAPRAKPDEGGEARAAEAGEDFDLRAFDGPVLSLEEPGFLLNERQRRHAALLAWRDGGVLLVDREDVYNPAAMQLREAARLRGLAILRELEVPLEVIRTVYEAREKRLGRSGRRGSVPVQDRFLALLHEAAQRRASDIHMMVGRHEAVVRLRVDGVLETFRTLPAEEAHALCVAAFNLAEASDANYRPLEYQGARLSKMRVALPPEVMSIRLQFNPMLQGGRYMVARLLYEGAAPEVGPTLRAMGFLAAQERDLARLRRRVFGINVISGPTGSGKSTTLKRCLEILDVERHGRAAILTIEDPPEYTIQGVAQFPVLNASSDEERREKFRLAIVGALRSDPDIMMIGEMRDQASTSLAFQAAMTGHQVWTTVHANDALSIVDRLRDLGADAWKLQDAGLLTGLISQRLVRRLCPDCALAPGEAVRRGAAREEEVREYGWVAELGGELRFANPGGCAKCRDGYRGRELIAETLVTDDGLLRMALDGRKREAHRRWREELGGVDMVEHAFVKIHRSVADPRDVAERVGEIPPLAAERARWLLEGA